MTELSTEPETLQKNSDGPEGPSEGRGKMMRWFFVIFLIFAILGVYSVLQRRNEHQVLAQQTEQMTVPYVSVIHAAPINGTSEMVLPGTLKANVESPIYARTSGYLKAWYKDMGSRVKTGEVLAEIDSPEVDQQLAQARAELASSQANLSLSGITAARYQDLLKTESVSHQDVDNANGDLAAKRAMEQSAEANVKRLEDLESFKRVYAPFSGVITQRNVDPGTLINAGNGGAATKEMFDLAQIDPMRVFVAVPQAFGPSLRMGTKACLSLSEIAGRSFCGKVVRTANSIDPGTRTLLTEVDVPNPSGTLLPGAYAQVHFDVRLSGQRLSLPINALLFRPEGTMAAVVGADNHLTMKPLTIGRDFGNAVEVLDGISASDSVVINPPDALQQGEEVKITRENADGSMPQVTPSAATH